MRARKLSDRQADAMYELFLKGESAKDLADAYGISVSTVSRYLGRMRERGEDMSKQERVIAGNKKRGRLVCTSTDGRQYKGTHLMPDGTMRSWKFTSMNQHMAIERWEKWCQEQDDEHAFMDMVERKPTEEPEVATEDVPATEDAPADEDVSDVPTDDEIYETQSVVDDAVEAHLADVSVPLDSVIADTELPEPKLASWSNENGSFRVVCTSRPSYVVWAKGDSLSIYGLFYDMEAALNECDRANRIASCLGRSGAFEVEEASWM